MNDMKIIKSLEESGLLIMGTSERIKNKAEEQKGFLGLLLDTRCQFMGEYLNT